MASVHSYQSRDDSEMIMIGHHHDPHELLVTASTLEVDYDKNLTELYQAITDQNWLLAATICQNDPIQAAIWVVRHYNEDPSVSNNNENRSSASSAVLPGQEPEIMWRFLPLHSACARQPPYDTLVALLNAYPDAAKCVDDQGMYALHYACGNQADESIIRLLLNTFAKAASISDPRGMLPLHYTACWGPSSTALAQGMLQQLIEAYPAALLIRDHDGNTPLDLAMEGEYPEKHAVADILRKWTKKQQKVSSNGSVASSAKGSNKLIKIRQTGSNGSEYGDAIFVDTASTKKKNKNTQMEPPEATTPSIVRSAVPVILHPLQDQSQQTETRVSSPPLIPNRGSYSKSPIPVSATKTSSNLAKEGRDVNLDQNQEKDDVVVETVSSASDAAIIRDKSPTKQQMSNNVPQQDDFLVMMNKCSLLDSELKSKMEQIKALEKELDATKVLLEESKVECADLKKMLHDTKEQHDILTRKSANTHDRLSTLSISLESMKEQQAILTSIISERNTTHNERMKQRQALMDQIIQMDEIIANDENNIDISLKKQTREMEAISAVINAALD